jgi:succinate dehydrogenase/fumarate reductase flavoprotein subunit
MAQSWDEVVDGVVVGSGGAALVAATLAADGGSQVLVLEKAQQIGGTTAVSGGGVWVPCNKHMAVLGVSDSREEALAYIRALAKDSAPDPDLIEAFVDTGPEMVDYLEARTPLRFFATAGFTDYYSTYGVPGAKPQGRSLEPVPFPVGVELPAWRDRLASRITMATLGGNTTLEEDLSGKPVDQAEIARRVREDIRPKGAALIGALFKGLLDRGVEVRVGVRVREAVLADEGAVVGLVAEQGGVKRRIGARQGVVLACGGFEHNPELVKTYVGYALHPLSPPNNVGDGLLIAMQAGAALANMNSYWGSGAMVDPTVTGPDGAPLVQFDVGRGMPGTFIVNQDAKRFANENVPYNDWPRAFGHFDATQANYANRAPAWQIFDHKLKEGMPILSMQPGKPAPAWIAQAPTIRELAGKIGLDPDALETTLRRFNEGAARGEDPDFRRHEIAFQRLSKLRPVDSPPYYAISIFPAALGTNGGPKIDRDGRVARASGGCVPGLYAAGNTAANAFGWAYPSGGGTLGNGLVFGYRAGRRIAVEARRTL